MPIGEIDAPKHIAISIGHTTVFSLLIFGVSDTGSRSFAGSFAKGETKLLLSYPVKVTAFPLKIRSLCSGSAAVYGSYFQSSLYFTLVRWNLYFTHPFLAYPAIIAFFALLRQLYH
jgi:hypothetical protein